MKKTFILLILSTIGTLLINCTGDKGAIGPNGAVGQQGSKGDKGETGASGEFPKTQTGTFTIKVSDWKTNSVYTDDDSYYAIVPVSAINKNILDKGIVNVWWLFNANQQIPLPFDRNSNRILYASYLEKGEGRIRIDIYRSGNSLIAQKPGADWNFRWILN
ncbi:MAG: collagen-like protein [Leadbetterella sp.]|nr:collagen-like protein [Leadbetterella sp.]